MNYKGNNQQCDICADKGCIYCNRKTIEPRSIDMCDMYYCRAQFVELIYTRETKTVSINKIDRAIIKDVGLLATKSHSQCLPDAPIFWPIPITYEEVLGENLQLIVSGDPIFWNKELIKKIVAYTLIEGKEDNGK